MSIKELVEQLNDKLTQEHSNYTKLHDELNKFRGKEINESNIETINKILNDIQNKFGELYDAYHFIAIRHQSAVNTANHYEEFMKSIKNAGAIEDKVSIN